MADKFLALDTDGSEKEITPITQSTGGADAGKLVALEANGLFHSSVMPAGSGYDVRVLQSAEILPAGAYVNIFTESGVAKIRLADATNPAKFAHGFILDPNNTVGSNSTVYFEGINNQHSSLTPGAEYFLSDIVPGGAITPPPVGPGKIVQKLGPAVSATEIKFEKHPHIKLA